MRNSKMHYKPEGQPMNMSRTMNGSKHHDDSNRTNENLNYSFQNENSALLQSNHVDPQQVGARLSQLENMVEVTISPSQKLFAMQITAHETQQILLNKLTAVDRKLDQLLHDQTDKENHQPNLANSRPIEKVRSGSGIQSKVNRSFFQEDEINVSLMGRMESKKTNKSLMSIEQRKRLIDRQIEKRLKGDVEREKRRKIGSEQKYY